VLELRVELVAPLVQAAELVDPLLVLQGDVHLGRLRGRGARGPRGRGSAAGPGGDGAGASPGSPAARPPARPRVTGPGIAPAAGRRPGSQAGRGARRARATEPGGFIFGADRGRGSSHRHGCPLLCHDSRVRRSTSSGIRREDCERSRRALGPPRYVELQAGRDGPIWDPGGRSGEVFSLAGDVEGESSPPPPLKPPHAPPPAPPWAAARPVAPVRRFNARPGSAAPPTRGQGREPSRARWRARGGDSRNREGPHRRSQRDPVRSDPATATARLPAPLVASAPRALGPDRGWRPSDRHAQPVVEAPWRPWHGPPPGAPVGSPPLL